MGLTINVKKTKSMTISKKQQPPNCKLTIGEKSIEQKDKFNYLGNFLTADGKSKTAIRTPIAMAKNKFQSMKQILTNRNLSNQLKIRLLKCYIWPVLMYGCETWTITPGLKGNIEAAEMWFLRRMFKISYRDRVSNIRVLERAKTTRELLNCIQKRQLTFLGHSIRRGKLECLALEGRLEGKRSRGRQRTKFLDIMANSFEASGVTITVPEMLHCAYDRDAWKGMVGQLKVRLRRKGVLTSSGQQQQLGLDIESAIKALGQIDTTLPADTIVLSVNDVLKLHTQPRKTSYNNKKKPWFSDHLRSLRSNSLRLRHMTKLDPSFAQDFCIARIAYQKGIRNAKSIFIKKQSEDLIIKAKEHGIKALFRHDKFYVFGGNLSNSCEYYSPHDDSWRSLPKMKEERIYAGCCYDNNKFIYVVGGWDKRNEICLTSMERFNVENEQWSILKSSIGVGREGLTLTVFKNQIILIGGRDIDNKKHKTIQKYDSISDSCTKSLRAPMGFLGCIGQLMAGTGLAQVLEVTYSENDVKHMLTGKAIDIAVRGHFMVYTALTTILEGAAYNIPPPTIPDEDSRTSDVPDDGKMNLDEPDDGQDVPCDENNDDAKTDKDITTKAFRELFDNFMTNPLSSASLDMSSEDTLRLLMES
ncbi:Kelch-like ECH-associated protein 1 [Nymphon striatum]|nr:Kelch-like ECH-associated protein 1 [Nymphon striatum]